MGQVEEALRIRRFEFEHLPTPQDFTLTIEPSNVPAVFYGAIKGWKAFSKWNPFNGGLDYLQEKVGSATVEAMRSRSAPVFYGDLRSHERVPVPFSTFITACKFYLQNVNSVNISFVAQEDLLGTPVNSEEACSISLDTPDQYYLAQVPILNAESKEKCPLEVLGEDIQTPIFLATTTLASINLWMNRAQSRSSTHYDPHHNLLCVVAGCKNVFLWPPSASRVLYPMPIYGEASNHSAVDLENPDLLVHSRARHSKEYSQKVTLHSGDALFIPEGWFHQVDSDDLTIAVNFWWKSNMMSNMLEHMDAYYLRRILNRLVDKEMIHMLQGSSVDILKGTGNHQPTNETCEAGENRIPTNDAAEGYHEFDSIELKRSTEGNSEKHGPILNQLEPLALHVLHELVSLVHDNDKISGQDHAVESTSMKDLAIDLKSEHMQSGTDNSSLLEKDPVASIVWAVEPLILQKVLLAMVHHFPRTLEALILHMLSPAAAEVLTRKFDEMDQRTTKEQQSQFYEQFYSVFDDQGAAMDAILNGKESFAFQAFQRVFDQYVGVAVDKVQIV